MTINWDSFWDKSAIDEIINVDFFDCRPYILNYLPSEGKIIEAGSGTGRYVLYLSKMGFDVVGIDISSGALNVYNRLRRKLKLGCRCLKGDVANIPCPGNYFTAYLSLGVIEHFEEGPHRVLAEAYRVLKPGGIAIITTPNRYSLAYIPCEIRDLSRRLVKKYFNPVYSVYRKYRKTKDSPFFQYWYSPSEVACFAKKAGFEVLDSATTGLLDAIWLSRIKTFRNKYESYRAINKLFSNSPLAVFGQHSIVIAKKPLASGNNSEKKPIKTGRIKSNYICSIPDLPEEAECSFCGSIFFPLYLDFKQMLCDKCRLQCKNIHFRNKLTLTQYKYINYSERIRQLLD